MFFIIEAPPLGPGVKQFRIAASRMARSQKPGQFVIVRLNDRGEGIPLTIKASDPMRGTITLVVQSTGRALKTSKHGGFAGGDIVT